MRKYIPGRNYVKLEVNNETAMGLVELTIEDIRDGTQKYISLTNSELMNLAISLLECVEYTR